MPLLDPAENAALIDAARSLATATINADEGSGEGGIDKETRDDARAFLRKMWASSTIEDVDPPADADEPGDGAES